MEFRHANELKEVEYKNECDKYINEITRLKYIVEEI